MKLWSLWISFLLLGCQGHLTKIVFVLDWTPNTNHTGIYVALEKGYFKDKRIDLHIIQPGQMSSSEKLVAMNKAQLGISSAGEFLFARSHGLPIISLAAVVQHNHSGFYSLKSKNILSPKDFVHKIYGSWGSEAEIAKVKTIMKITTGKENQMPKIVTIKNTNLVTLLHSVDFIWGYKFWEGVELSQHHLAVRYLPITRYSQDLDDYSPIIIANTSFMKENLQLMKNIMQAICQGYQFSIEHPLEAADLLVKNVPELNRSFVEQSQKMLSPYYQDDAPYWGYQSLDRYLQYYQWNVRMHLIPSFLHPSEDLKVAFTNDFLSQRKKES